MSIQVMLSQVEKGLRPLNPMRDLSQLADLIENAFGDELSFEGNRILRELRFLGMLGPLNILVTGVQSEMNDMFTGFVWVQDGHVVGNITVNRPTGHPRRWQISNVAVLDTYRGQGIARQLVEAALDLVLRQGGDTAYLYVRDDNAPALHLYRSVGFVEVDRAADLEVDRLPSPATQPRPLRPQDLRSQELRPLTLAEGEKLFDLVSASDSAGYRWLYTAQRSQYVFSPDERVFRWIESLFSGEAETHWGIFEQSALVAGLVLRARHGLNRRSHSFKVWVRADYRGQVEEQLAHDLATILAQKSERPVQTTLPSCESAAIDALIRQGFRQSRTLILMKMNV